MDAGDFLIDETGIGGDALGPLIMWTFSRPWYVINSKMTAKESIMRGYNGVLAYNLDRSSATILATRLEVGGIALAFSDLLASTIHAAHNEIVPLGPGVASIVMWSGNIGTGIVDSTLLIDNNVFGGDIGVLSDPGTFRNVDCRLVNNDITGVGVPYLFSEGSECLTVGSFELKH
jgi:hypothetical protein